MIKIEDIMEIFSERLKDLIEEKNMNYQQLSVEIGIPRTTINSWILKNRSPRIDSLYTLADYFKVSIDYLSGREN